MSHPTPDFVARHVGPRQEDVDRMLEVVGYDSLEALVEAATPEGIRGAAPLAIEAADSVVSIPMQHGVDSLNVASASAVALWALRR